MLFMTKVYSTMVSKKEYWTFMALCLTPIGYVRLKKYKLASANNNDYKPLSKEKLYQTFNSIL